MHIDLTGQTVIVTGGARGIGRVIVEAFLCEGANVVAVDVTAPVEGELAARYPTSFIAVEADVRSRTSVEDAVAQVIERYSRIDVLVNNAGINVEGPVDTLGDDDWDRCFDVNVGGVFRMSRAVIPTMKQQGSGRIINAASFAAIIPSIGSAAYASSKAAVVQLTRVLAGELGPWNITVNAYAPGMVPSEMNGFSDLPADRQNQLLDTLSLRRWGTAADIANLLTFVASDQASYITGTLLDVSGGKLATQIPSRAYPRL